MSEDFKCQADDFPKGDVVSADASSIERGAEAFKPDWELTTPEQMSVALTLAFARCAPEFWRETGATDEELDAVSEDVLRQLRQRQTEEEPEGDDERSPQAQHQPDTQGDPMSEDLTPPQYRCYASECPSVHRLVIDGKRHLLIRSMNISDRETLRSDIQYDPKASEATILIEEDLLSGIGCQAEVTAKGERSSPSALQLSASAEAVDWDSLYEIHFPHRTDPTSRHVKMIAEGLRDLRSPMRAALAEFEPDHMAASIEQTVKMLWEARQEIERLQRPTEEAGTADERTAEQRDASLTCHDCGRLYGDEHGFPDLVVPHDVWRQISPTGDEGGLLCPSCICARAHNAGIETIAEFRSGPFATMNDGPVTLANRARSALTSPEAFDAVSSAMGEPPAAEEASEATDAAKEPSGRL
jgi:hypothetical protein